MAQCCVCKFWRGRKRYSHIGVCGRTGRTQGATDSCSDFDGDPNATTMRLCMLCLGAVEIRSCGIGGAAEEYYWCPTCKEER